MPIVIGAVAGGAVIYRISHSDYSDSYYDWRDYSNWSDYSDYAERQRVKRTAKEKELSAAQNDLDSYIKSQLNALKSEYQLTGKLPAWSSRQAHWSSFETDYAPYNEDLKNVIKSQLEARLKNEIAQDEQAINAIDDMLVKVNKAKLLKK